MSARQVNHNASIIGEKVFKAWQGRKNPLTKKPARRSLGPAVFPALAWLSLAGLLLSRARLRQRQTRVRYSLAACRARLMVVDRPALATPPSLPRGAAAQSRWEPLGASRRGDWPAPPNTFSPLAAWWNSLSGPPRSRLNNSMRRAGQTNVWLTDPPLTNGPT